MTIASGATLAQNGIFTTTAGGSIVINGGTLKNTAVTSAGTFYSANAAMTIGTGGATLEFGGVDTGGQPLLSICSGSISGAAGNDLRKTGNSALALTSATNTYAGATIIDAGEIRVRTNSNVLPITTALVVNAN